MNSMTQDFVEALYILKDIKQDLIDRYNTDTTLYLKIDSFLNRYNL